jgi:hypothetical protein
MTIDRRTSAQSFVELQTFERVLASEDRIEVKQYFDRFLHVFDMVFFDVMMRSNRVLQFFVDDDAWPLSAWTRYEEHDASTYVRIECLRKQMQCSERKICQKDDRIPRVDPQRWREQHPLLVKDAWLDVPAMDLVVVHPEDPSKTYRMSRQVE